jgi:protein-disulfide isomerase
VKWLDSATCVPYRRLGFFAVKSSRPPRVNFTKMAMRDDSQPDKFHSDAGSEVSAGAAGPDSSRTDRAGADDIRTDASRADFVSDRSAVAQFGPRAASAKKHHRAVTAALLTVTGMLAIAIVFAFLPLVRARAGGRTAQNGDGKQNDAQPGEQNGDPKQGSRPVPLGPRQDVMIGDAPVRGSRNAAVTIVEFADYQCPYCQQMHPELKVLQEELAGKVALVFKDFPLDMHINAEKAAEAARCAGEQGKYWDFHDTLFHNSDRLEVPQLKQYARDLKLNQSNFDTCLDSGKEAAAIQKDLAQGRQLGVRGTPSFFFNGRMVSGSMDYYTLRGIVEDVIKSDAPASAAAIPAGSGPGK